MQGTTDQQWAEVRKLIDALIAAKAEEDRLTALSNEADAAVAQAQAALDQEKVIASDAKVSEARAEAAFAAAQDTLRNFLDRLADPVVGLEVKVNPPTTRP